MPVSTSSPSSRAPLCWRGGCGGDDPWDLSVTPATGLTPSPPIPSPLHPFPGNPSLPHLRPHPGPHQPGLSPSPLPTLLLSVSLSLGLSPSLPTSACVSRSLLFLLRPPLFAVLSHLSPDMSPPLAGQPLTLAHSPLSVRPNLPRLWPRGNPSIVEGAGWEGQPWPWLWPDSGPRPAAGYHGSSYSPDGVEP